MDPILVAAAREFLQKQDRLQKQGVQLQPQQIDEFVKTRTNGKYGADDLQKLIGSIDTDINPRNLARSAVQGATMKWGDEALRWLPESIGGGESGKQEMRLRDEMFGRAHGVADGIANVVGGVGAAVATGGLMPELEGAAVGARAVEAGAAAMKTGAAYGAIQGAGEANNMKSMAGKALVGGVTGGVTGGVMGSGAARLKDAFSVESRVARKVERAIEMSGGIGAVKAKLQEAVDAGVGGVVKLADLSPHLQMLLRYAVNNNPDAMVAAGEQLDARGVQQASRFLEAVKDGFNGKLPNAEARAAQLAKGTKSFGAGPNGYQGIRDANPIFDRGAIAQAMSHPKIQQAWQTAVEAEDINSGGALDNLMKRLSQSTSQDERLKIRQAIVSGATETADGSRPVSFTDLQRFKRIMDGRVKKAFDSGDGALGEAYSEVRDKIREQMVKEVPTYARVDKVYSLRKSLENVLKDGVDALHTRDNVDLIKSDWNSLSKLEQNEFRTGIASKLVTDMQNAEKNQSLAQRLAQPSDAMEEKLKIIFGDDKNFQKFLKRAGWERTMARSRAAIGGAQTHFMGALADHNPLDGAPPSVGKMFSPSHWADKAVHALVGVTNKNATQDIAGQVGDQVLTTGEDKIRSLFGNMNDLAPLLSRRVLQGIGGASGNLFH